MCWHLMGCPHGSVSDLARPFGPHLGGVEIQDAGLVGIALAAERLVLVLLS